MIINHFFDQPVKIKQEAYEKLIEMSRNDDYTTWNLLDYLYHQKYYKRIGIDVSRQTNISIPQQTNFVGRLEDDVATIFFIAGTTKNDTLMLILLMIIILNLSSIKLNC